MEESSLLARSEAAAAGNGDERVPFERGNDANDAPLPFTSTATKDSVVQQGEQGQTRKYVPLHAATSGQSQVVGSTPTAVTTYQSPPVVADFSQQLEPRTMPEAIQLAKYMFESRLFSDYGTPQAVLSSVLAGREMGIPAMASLRSFYVRKGKTNMHAAAIIAVVLKSGKAQYFRCTERTAERATYVTKRGNEPEMSLTFTIEEGRAAFDGDDKSWKASGWGKNPADMVTKTAGSKLARLVYPDVVAGLYAPEEME